MMLPNKLIRSYLLALQDLLGKNGVNAVLNVSGLAAWIENFPPEDDTRAITYEDFSRIQASIEDIYGDRAGQNLSRQAAHNSFASVGASQIDSSETDLSGEGKSATIKQALNNFVSIFDPDGSGDVGWTGTDEEIAIHFDVCPNCVGRETESPICKACAGWIEGLLDMMAAGDEIKVNNTTCRAVGDSKCTFVIQSI